VQIEVRMKKARTLRAFRLVSVLAFGMTEVELWDVGVFLEVELRRGMPSAPGLFALMLTVSILRAVPSSPNIFRSSEAVSSVTTSASGVAMVLSFSSVRDTHGAAPQRSLSRRWRCGSSSAFFSLQDKGLDLHCETLQLP
jgi:hypothetical protein